MQPRSLLTDLTGPLTPEQVRDLVAELVVGLGPLVWEVLRNKGVPPDDAEEERQKVFLKALLNLVKRKRLPKSLEAWLITIAVHVAMDYHRKRKREAAHQDAFIAFGTGRTVSDPEEEASRIEVNERIKTAIESLRPAQRVVVTRHFFKGFSIQDIASELGISPSAVQQRITRAKRELYGKLRGLGDDFML